MLIICREMRFDGLVDGREVRALRHYKCFIFRNRFGVDNCLFGDKHFCREDTSLSK